MSSHSPLNCRTTTLDEFPEFEKRVLESLREPLEPAFALWSYGVAREKFVSISRAKGTEVFPANFILVAAMNPCPCGFKGTKKECVCSAGDIYKYERKLSGPIMDRVNIFLRHAVAFGGGWLPVAEIWGLEINKVPSSVSDFCKIWFF